MRQDAAERSSNEAGALLSAEGIRVPGGRRRLARDLGRLAGHASLKLGRAVRLSFALADDARMRATNRACLGHDHATDVLAFPMEDDPVLEGEVLISVETACREADRRGHPAYHEILLYAVHGVLHLMGHDDHGAAERRRMRRAERAALAALGIPPVFGRRSRPAARGRSRRPQGGASDGRK